MIRNLAITVMFVLGFVYSQEWTYLKAGRSGLASNYVKSIQIVKGVMYAATDKGVSIISLTKDSIAQIDKTKMPKGVPSCMQAVGDTMWIGAGNTLVIYNMVSGTLVSIASEESGIQNTITSIAGSGDDVWIGTDGGGAFAFSRSGRHFTKFNRNSGLSSDNIRSVTALSDTILFGTSANGISLYSRNDERHSRLDRYDGLTNNFVTAFVQAFGKLYVGTYKGLSIFDPAKRDLRVAPGSRVMKEDLILSMAGDGRYLWLGGMGLVTRYDTKTDSVQSWSKAEGVPEDFITGLAVYRDYLYAATDGNGIAILNKKVPTVSLDRIDFKNRKGIVYGNFDSQSQPLTQSWSFFSPAARSVVFSKGVSPTGQSNGA
ncbi:MAG: hypothetical protein JNL74_04295, partial [Fibrobacteres bacterium]|nr:hypothetical protein [Fibrobacterota bacterium]